MYIETNLHRAEARSIESLHETLCSVVRNQCPSYRNFIDNVRSERVFISSTHNEPGSFNNTDRDSHMLIKGFYAYDREDLIDWSLAKIINKDCTELRAHLPMIAAYPYSYHTVDFIYRLTRCESKGCNGNFPEELPCVTLELSNLTGCCARNGADRSKHCFSPNSTILTVFVLVSRIFRSLQDLGIWQVR